MEARDDEGPNSTGLCLDTDPSFHKGGTQRRGFGGLNKRERVSTKVLSKSSTAIMRIQLLYGRHKFVI